MNNDKNYKFDTWQLAVGKDVDVKKVADFFGLEYHTDENDKAKINHSLVTAVIDPSGKVTRILTGNSWTTAQLLDELVTRRQVLSGEAQLSSTAHCVSQTRAIKLPKGEFISMRKPLVITAILVLCVVSLASAQKRNITEKDLFDFAWVGDPQISPDGNTAVFVKVTVNADQDELRHVHMGRLDGR